MESSDPELKILVKETLEIAKANQEALKKIHGHQVWARWFSFFKWFIIIGSTFGTLYYFQPMIDNLLGTYKELLGPTSDLGL